MGGAATTRVNRTPSGLPLCSTCHKELGFCAHTPIFRDRPRYMEVAETEGSTAVSAAAGNGESVPDTDDVVPNALSINASSQSGESNTLEDYLRQGTKRRRSAALEDVIGKGKRRGILSQPKVSPRIMGLCEIATIGKTTAVALGYNSCKVKRLKYDDERDVVGGTRVGYKLI